MSVHPRLLDHPFYSAWTRGEITLPALAAYHRSYGAFIRHLPELWTTVVTALHPDDPLGASVIADETDHIRLWEEWGRALPDPDSVPSLDPVIEELRGMSPSRLLGALQAFEIQQPEVARTKREGLVAHYGFSPDTLRYFDEHEREEPHIRYGRRLAAFRADRAEFDAGLREGAALFYRSLDAFLSTN